MVDQYKFFRFKTFCFGTQLSKKVGGRGSCTFPVVQCSLTCLMRIRIWVLPSNQYDQMDILYFNIWAFSSIKFCPIVYYFAKVVSKFCQLLKDPQTLPNVFKSGKISPNLAILLASQVFVDLTFLINPNKRERQKKWGIKKFSPIPVQGSGVIRFVWSLCVRPSVCLSVCVKENHE